MSNTAIWPQIWLFGSKYGYLASNMAIWPQYGLNTGQIPINGLNTGQIPLNGPILVPYPIPVPIPPCTHPPVPPPGYPTTWHHPLPTTGRQRAHHQRGAQRPEAVHWASFVLNTRGLVAHPVSIFGNRVKSDVFRLRSNPTFKK